jgi:hypothetical protein
MKILCIAGDPGGTRTLSAVIAELIQRGVDVQLVGYRQAIGIMAEHGLPVAFCDESMAENAAQHLRDWAPDLLLASTSINGQDYEKRFIQAARSIGLPSIGVLDFWANYRGRFSTQPPDGPLNAVPDLITVMDDKAVDDMVHDGIARECMIVTGQPAFDELYLPSDVPSVRRQVREAIGCAQDDLLLIFASQPFTDVSAETGFRTVPFDEMEVLELFLQSLRQTEAGSFARVWIRPHPREGASKFEPFCGPQVFVSSTFDRVQAIRAADAVTGMSSTFLFEAALLGLPVLSIQPRQVGEGPIPLASQGLGEITKSAEECPAAVQRLLAACRLPAASRTPGPGSPFRPGAAGRVADVVIDRIRSRRAS